MGSPLIAMPMCLSHMMLYMPEKQMKRDWTSLVSLELAVIDDGGLADDLRICIHVPTRIMLQCFEMADWCQSHDHVDLEPALDILMCIIQKLPDSKAIADFLALMRHYVWKYLLSWRTSRSSLGYYNILNEKAISLRRSRRSQPLLSLPRSDVGHVNVRLVGAYRPHTFFHYSFLTERFIPSLSFPPLVSCRETWWVCANL